VTRHEAVFELFVPSWTKAATAKQHETSKPVELQSHSGHDDILLGDQASCCRPADIDDHLQQISSLPPSQCRRSEGQHVVNAQTSVFQYWTHDTTDGHNLSQLNEEIVEGPERRYMLNAATGVLEVLKTIKMEQNM